MDWISSCTDHHGRDARNDTDGIFDNAGLMATSRQSDRMLAAINLGIDVWRFPRPAQFHMRLFKATPSGMQLVP
ncbi:hypothetical protein ABI214_16380 [Prescottella soli]|uniref:Uncharacterized protein n=1 Tax=Prescottella soli TaxID=1543852 RepID=A0ABW9FVR2_9NOCA